MYFLARRGAARRTRTRSCCSGCRASCRRGCARRPGRRGSTWSRGPAGWCSTPTRRRSSGSWTSAPASTPPACGDRPCPTRHPCTWVVGVGAQGRARGRPRTRTPPPRAARLRFAVADGATEGWESGAWAAHLAAAYVRRPAGPGRPSPTGSPPPGRAGRRRPRRPGPVVRRGEAGAGGVRHAPRARVPPPAGRAAGWAWQAVAVGDSCLFLVRGGQLRRSPSRSNRCGGVRQPARPWSRVPRTGGAPSRSGSPAGPSRATCSCSPPTPSPPGSCSGWPPPGDRRPVVGRRLAPSSLPAEPAAGWVESLETRLEQRIQRRRVRGRRPSPPTRPEPIR